MLEIDIVVKQAVSEVLSIPFEDIELEDDLVESLGVDSLDQVQIAMELEDVLETRFPDSQFDKIVTVLDLVNFASSIDRRSGK